MPVLTRAMRMAIAPPARIERAMTSSGVNPIWSPMIVVAARSAAVISALLTVDHLSPLKNAARCVSGGAPLYRKCSIWSRMAATTHAWGCPVAPCPIYSHLVLFFCILKGRLMKVAVAQEVG